MSPFAHWWISCGNCNRRWASVVAKIPLGEF